MDSFFSYLFDLLKYISTIYLFIYNATAALPTTRGRFAQLGHNCTPFGLSLTVTGRTEVRIVTLPPNFAKPYVVRRFLFIPQLNYFHFKSLPFINSTDLLPQKFHLTTRRHFSFSLLRRTTRSPFLYFSSAMQLIIFYFTAFGSNRFH